MQFSDMRLVDSVNEHLVTKIPIPMRDFQAKPHMIVIRSFDVNKPGAEIEELKGGVAGGSILTGIIKLDDEIEVTHPFPMYYEHSLTFSA